MDPTFVIQSVMISHRDDSKSFSDYAVKYAIGMPNRLSGHFLDQKYRVLCLKDKGIQSRNTGIRIMRVGNHIQLNNCNSGGGRGGGLSCQYGSNKQMTGYERVVLVL